MPGTNRTRVSTPSKRARTTPTKVMTRKRKPKVQKISYSIGNVFAPMYRNTMHYNFVGSLGITAGAYTTYKFAANGLFKPDLSVAATQPLGFATLATIYEYYTVLSSKIKVEYMTVAGIQNGLTLGVLLDADTTAPTTIAQAINQQNSTSVLANLYGEKNIVLNKYFSTKVQFGNDNPQGDPDVSATGGANPANLAVFCLYAAENSGLTMTVYFKVSIQYEVLWHERLTYAFP